MPTFKNINQLWMQESEEQLVVMGKNLITDRGIEKGLSEW